ncbi:hypothetical protein VIN01S_04900 [Vibrio inusitatus NBRC 102082]|uniref:Uncharacterized protein n=1 Tax=Vibrio inusitatus NBRC 102082 TaxID=1219070 RepID=A0A4Y3HRI8_9VIBR|nr:DUF1254 domain-containing protein [Vibrio inusitatus]GEA49686.1 hypothetical protein VIN01S_04900 [Vibrio inusitatus NBRC 102082]
MKKSILVTLMSLVSASVLATEVTKDNYVEAETDWYFSGVQEKSGVNSWMHDAPVSIENQQVIRSNRDVVYSIAIVDVSEGATFTVPESEHYQLIHIMDELHLSHQVVSRGESLTISANDINGEYVYVLARTKIAGDDTAQRQQQLKIVANAARPYPSKGFAEDDVKALRQALVMEFIEGKAKILEHKSFVKELEQADPISYLYATAVGYGGLPSYEAQYLPYVVGGGSAKECQTFNMPKPELDYENGGFFSLTTYDTAGWIVEDNFYIGHENMKDNGETFEVVFNCPDVAHSVDVQEGWTGVWRFYKPSNEMAFIEFIDSIRGVSVQ